MHGTNTRFDRLPWLDRGPANGPDSARCSRSPSGWRRSAIHLLSRLGFNRATTAMVGKTAPAAVRCYERQVPNQPRGRRIARRRLRLPRRRPTIVCSICGSRSSLRRVICDRVAAEIICRRSGCCFRTGRAWSVSGARPRIVKGEVDDESWCGLSAGRAWRRYRGGQGVCPGGRRPGLRPYCDLRPCAGRRSPIRLRADPNE